MSSSPSEISLRLVIDKTKHRVVFAEAGHEFVDVLLSFLTLPLGTIIRLTGKTSDADPVTIGSLSNLYRSVENLDANCFSAPTHKDLLLQPPTSASLRLHPNLTLNIDDTLPIKYFMHYNPYCYLLSTFKNAKCKCGRLKNVDANIYMKTDPKESSHIGDGVFVRAASTYIVSDDLKVMPNLLDSTIKLFRNLGIDNVQVLEEKTVNVDLNMILYLLKSLFLSKTPLSDLFLRNKKITSNESELFMFSTPTIHKDSEKDNRTWSLKVYRRKSTKKVLVVQSDASFVDLLLSFLAVPLGSVVNLLGGNSAVWCVDNLHETTSLLSVNNYLKSKEHKMKLVMPKMAPQFLCDNSLLNICEEISFSINNVGTKFMVLDNKETIGEGFTIDSSMFMVTDDLVVTPFSSASVISYLNRLKIPLADLEEQSVTIKQTEVLSILKASLSSSSTFTLGLQQLVLEKPKQEKRLKS